MTSSPTCGGEPRPSATPAAGASPHDATALARDLRALLASVLGHTETLDRALADRPLGQASIDAIREAATSALSVADRLRDAAELMPQDVPGTTDVDRLLRAAGAELARRHQDRLSIVVHAAPRLWMAAVDAALVQDGMTALVSHAAEVVPHGATVRVRMSNVEFAAARPLAGGAGRTRYVRVEMALPEGTAHLGLSAAARGAVLVPSTRVERSLCALHAAGVRVAIDGDGEAATLVSFLLPAGRDAAAVSAPRPSDATATADGPQTLGLVDADGARRALLCKILAAQGYRVVASGSARELDLGVCGPLDLLLTDRMEPVRNGGMAGESGYPVLYIGRGAPAADARWSGPVAAIPQPFGAAALITAVRHLLGARSLKSFGFGPIPCQEGA